MAQRPIDCYALICRTKSVSLRLTKDLLLYSNENGQVMSLGWRRITLLIQTIFIQTSFIHLQQSSRTSIRHLGNISTLALTPGHLVQA